LATEAGADLLHITHNRPSILASVPTVVSPCEFDAARAEKGLVERLRHSLGRGGLAAGARWILWPSDLPAQGPASARLLSPVVHPDFGASPPAPPGLFERLNLPESFILYHGSFDPAELRILFDAWTWGAGPIGDYYPLLLAGGQEAGDTLKAMIDQYRFGEAVQLLPPLTPPEIPHIYRRASALIHPGTETPWGGAIRQALASGLPVVTTDSLRNNALVGPAAFTIPAGDARKLGAALITVIVEEEVAQKLSHAARQRAAGWSRRDFRAGLGKVYSESVAKPTDLSPANP
jgi:glycosyltransferase involved in cell wall biosynthesis